MLFADQAGEKMQTCRARAGISWIRLITDLPTGFREILKGCQDWRSYMRSLRDFDVESVFSREDPLPGLAELGLLPYLAVKRGL